MLNLQQQIQNTGNCGLLLEVFTEKVTGVLGFRLGHCDVFALIPHCPVSARRELLPVADPDSWRITSRFTSPRRRPIGLDVSDTYPESAGYVSRYAQRNREEPSLHQSGNYRIHTDHRGVSVFLVGINPSLYVSALTPELGMVTLPIDIVLCPDPLALETGPAWPGNGRFDFCFRLQYTLLVRMEEASPVDDGDTVSTGQRS